MTKILLVEDDKSLREIYGVRLQAEGYQITSAGNGEEALALAIKERPDLIISDVMMPKISGFDMLDILRSTTETSGIRVIMMTALGSEDQRERGEALGADRYLVKSQVGIEDVVRTVHEVLNDAPGALQTPSSTNPTEPVPPAPPISPVFQQPAVPIIQKPQPIQAMPTSPVTPAASPVSPPQQLTTPLVQTPQLDPISPPSQTVQQVSDPQATQPVSTTPTPIIATTQTTRGQQHTPSALPPTNSTSPDLSANNPIMGENATQPNQDTATTTPYSPKGLPEPTAPFASPRPANLGDRIVQPLTNTNYGPPEDLGDRMSAELTTAQPPHQPAPQSEPLTAEPVGVQPVYDQQLNQPAGGPEPTAIAPPMPGQDYQPQPQSEPQSLPPEPPIATPYTQPAQDPNLSFEETPRAVPPAQ